MSAILHPDPADRKVIWVWNTKWRFREEACFLPLVVASFQVDRVLVALGLIDSRSEAQRLVKSGAVSWRKADVMDWVKVADFRQAIEPGWPWNVRVGNGNWRMMPRKESGPKWNQFPGIMTVMVPEENQTIDVWSEVWN